VHGSPAFFREFLVSGVGGEITKESREDFFVLRMPRWEVEYSLGFLWEFPQPKILLFHTPPVGTLDLDKGNHKGSRVVNDMIEKYKPSLVFCGHAHHSRGREEIGSSLVANPGSLKVGNYAILDSETREVEFHSVLD
jgi:Icc-related predicted phosphoesterase